jgi:hypothetical protein
LRLRARSRVTTARGVVDCARALRVRIWCAKVAVLDQAGRGGCLAGAARRRAECVAPTKGADRVQIWSFRQSALGICAAAMLAGCVGPQLPLGASGTSAITQVQSHHRTFQYTGREQSFKVPASVTSINVDSRGAAGAGHNGHGGHVRATIPVQPSETLAVFVGGAGGIGPGGFNGGGNGPEYDNVCPGFGGGGASDVRENGNTLRDRILVAGGGGGGAASSYDGGGGGGGGKKGGHGFPLKPQNGAVGGGGGHNAKAGPVGLADPAPPKVTAPQEHWASAVTAVSAAFIPPTAR